MAGTSAVAYKKALIDGLTTAMAAIPAVSTVQVSYHYPGRVAERELVHGGRAEGVQRYPVSGGGGVRFKRHEELVLKLHIVVNVPGSDPYAAEARCVEIGKVVEEYLAASPAFATVPGQLIQSGIAAVDLDSDVDDEGAMAVLTYDIAIETRLN